MLQTFPETASSVRRERVSVVDENTTRHTLNFSSKAAADLKRAKEVLSHRFPGTSDSEILAHALDFLLQHIDPLRKTNSAASASKRVTKAAVRRMALKLSEGRCSFKDETTDRICGSSYQVQIDHIVPKALGGTDDASNLRALCRNHNMLMAERLLGRNLMEKYRRH